MAADPAYGITEGTHDGVTVNRDYRSDTMTSIETPVDIVSYDSSWPRRFEDEAEVLRHALAPWLAGPIEHIGSTAVPGLSAKPTIDIMAGVETLDASRPAIAAAPTWVIAMSVSG